MRLSVSQSIRRHSSKRPQYIHELFRTQFRIDAQKPATAAFARQPWAKLLLCLFYITRFPHPCQEEPCPAFAPIPRKARLLSPYPPLPPSAPSFSRAWTDGLVPHRPATEYACLLRCRLSVDKRVSADKRRKICPGFFGQAMVLVDTAKAGRSARRSFNVACCCFIRFKIRIAIIRPSRTHG